MCSWQPEMNDMFSSIIKAVPRSGELHRLGIPPGERSWSVGSSTFFSSEAGWSCEETFWLKQEKMRARASISWDETIVSETFSLFVVKYKIDLLNYILIAYHWFLLLKHMFNSSKYNIEKTEYLKRSWLDLDLDLFTDTLEVLGQSSLSKNWRSLFLSHLWTKIWSDNRFETVLTSRMA